MGSAETMGGAFLPGADYVFTGVPTTAQNWLTTHKPGSVGATTVTALEQGSGIYRRTTLTLKALAMSLSDANVGGGSLIYTFPKGNVSILGGMCSVAETTTSVLASTLNTGVTLSVGVGSVQTVSQASGTLVTTEQDILTAFSATSSATINVPGANAAGKLSTTTLTRYDGNATAQAVYLNCGVPTGTDIDGDATTTWSGIVIISWIYNGTI